LAGKDIRNITAN